MPRFFVEETLAPDTPLLIRGEDARHIALSLRMRVGDTLTLSDGEQMAECRLDEISPDAVLCSPITVTPATGELPVSLRLYQGYPKGDKLELIAQKATELGASDILPFVGRRSVARPKQEKYDRLTERLSRIAREAAGQSGRAKLPKVSPPLSFAAALEDAAATCDAILFCYEDEHTRTLADAVGEAKKIGAKTLGIFVGPEGGFAPEEAESAISHGAFSVSLGARILRCETAPIYALAALGYAYEM